MRHQKTGRKLSRRKEHRKALLSNLAASLILHGRIKTTDAKAKEVRPFVERLVTFARRGDLHARRIVFSRLRDANAVKKLFDELGPQFASRNGGYTRIIKLGYRSGDNSPVSLIEFVSEDEPKNAPQKKKTSKAKAKKPAKVKAQADEAVAETAEETAAVEASDAAEEAAPEEKAVAVEAEEAPAVEAEKAPEAPEEEKADDVEADADKEKTEE